MRSGEFLIAKQMLFSAYLYYRNQLETSKHKQRQVYLHNEMDLFACWAGLVRENWISIILGPKSLHRRLRLQRTHTRSLHCRHSRMKSGRRNWHSSQKWGPFTRLQRPAWLHSWTHRRFCINWRISSSGGGPRSTCRSRAKTWWARSISRSSSHCSHPQTFQRKPQT